MVAAASSTAVLWSGFCANLAEALEAYLDHLRITKDASAHTLRAYRRDIGRWVAYMAALPKTQGWPEETSQTPQQCRQWALQYTRQPEHTRLARATVARQRSALRSFFTFAKRQRYIDALLLPDNLTALRQSRSLPKFLTQAELQALLAALDMAERDSKILMTAATESGNRISDAVQSALAARNNALLRLMFTSGLRVSEVTALTWGQLDCVADELRVVGKGSRERVAFFSTQARQALQAYQTNHWITLWRRSRKRKTPATQHAPHPDEPVFLSHHGRAMTSRSVGQLLAKLAQVAGLTQGVHPHMLRHGFATHLLNSGVDLRTVQALMGHVNIRSTTIYTHLTTERLREAYRQAHPRARQGK